MRVLAGQSRWWACAFSTLAFSLAAVGCGSGDEGSGEYGQAFEKPANTPPPRKEKPDKYANLHPREKRALKAQEGK